MTRIREFERITTGVPGLDFVLAGGFFETGVYIVQGGAGSGKTILANQICFHQAEQQKRAVYYTLLTESHDRMFAFLQHLTFFDANQISKNVQYVSGFKLLETEGLPGVVRSIRDIMSAQRPTLFVVDGVVTAEEIAPSDMVFKKFLHEIQTAATMFRCTVLMLTNTEAAKRLQAEHTMVDGIIELTRGAGHLTVQRALEVAKFRGAGQRRGPHTLELDDDGCRILPRLESAFHGVGAHERPTSRTRISTGVASLDSMLGGGLPSSSITMVLGPSGTCKTLLGMQFLDGGARIGERGLFFTFFEHPEELIEKAERLGMPAFAAAARRGDIDIVWSSSVEANLDRIGNDLVRVFDAHKPARVFVDGMHGFHVTSETRLRVQDFFGALADYFATQQTTFMFSAETEELVGQSAVGAPFPNASRICHNIFLTRYTELNGRLERVFTIVKMRDSGFEPAMRLMTVGEQGIELGKTVTGSLP